MKYIEIKINTTPQGIEPLSDRLTMIGADAFSIQDETDMLSFLENNKKYWDYIDDDLLENMRGVSRIVLYAVDDDAGRELMDKLPGELESLREARDDIDFGELDIHFTLSDDNEWLNSWRKYYKPFNVGTRIRVCPEWEDPGDSEGRIVFKSNPGLAFGSGIHETTRLCMELLDKLLKPQDKVLDLGCGSGILSVVSLLLGASKAFGIDLDDKAVSASKNNAALNNVSDKAEFIYGDIATNSGIVSIPEGGFDIICANIVSDVLIYLAPYINDFLKVNGYFISSGIIDTRLDEVCDAYEESGIKIVEILRDGGWCAVLCTRAN